MSKKLLPVFLVLLSGIVIWLVWLCVVSLSTPVETIVAASAAPSSTSPVERNELLEIKTLKPNSASTSNGLPFTIRDVELSDSFNIPLFEARTPEYAIVAERINTALQYEVLRGETIASWKENGVEKEFGSEFLNYQISYPVPAVVMVYVRGEGCGAYCSQFEDTYLFIIKTGQRVTPTDIFTEEGLSVLADELREQKNALITAFTVKAKNKLAKLAKNNSEERESLQIQIESYPTCIDEDVDYSSLLYATWIMSATSTTFIADSCFPHAISALDEVGEFALVKEYAQIREYFTPIGKELFIPETD